MREIAITENLAEKSRSDRLAGVDGHRCHAAIGMTQAMVAALRANHRETGFVQRTNQFFCP